MTTRRNLLTGIAATAAAPLLGADVMRRIATADNGGDMQILTITAETAQPGRYDGCNVETLDKIAPYIPNGSFFWIKRLNTNDWTYKLIGGYRKSDGSWGRIFRNAGTSILSDRFSNMSAFSYGDAAWACTLEGAQFFVIPMNYEEIDAM